MRTRAFALCLGGGAVACAAACRSPTEITVEVTTDVPCDQVHDATFTVGQLGDIESKPPASATTSCDPATGRLGAIVVVPSGSDGANVAFKIVGGVGQQSAENCAAPAYGPACIVARRALRFLPHQPLSVPVKLAQSCEGVICPPDQTCVEHTCQSATLDPGLCASPGGCGEGTLYPGVDAGVDSGAGDATLDVTADSPGDGPADGAPGDAGSDAIVPAEAGPVVGCGDGTGLQSGAPWPLFRACVSRIGESAAVGPRKASEQPAWSYPRPGGAVNTLDTSPAVAANGDVYVGGPGGQLFALTAQRTNRWSFTLGTPIWSSPAIAADGTVWIGSSDNHLYGLTPGATTVTTKCACASGVDGGPGSSFYSPPVIAPDGTVYAENDDGHLYAFNGNTCAFKWAFPTGATGSSASAIGQGGLVYVGGDQTTLYAVDPTTGTSPYRYAMLQDGVNSAPAVAADGTVYVVDDSSHLVSLGPHLTFNWSIGGSTSSPIAGSPAIASDGTIYYGSHDGSLYAVKPDKTIVWSFATGGPIDSSPAIGADGTVYFGSNDGYVYALTPAKQVLWKYKTGGAVNAAPAIGADGTLYVPSFDGNVYAFAP